MKHLKGFLQFINESLQNNEDLIVFVDDPKIYLAAPLTKKGGDIVNEVAKKYDKTVYHDFEEDSDKEPYNHTTEFYEKTYSRGKGIFILIIKKDIKLKVPGKNEYLTLTPRLIDFRYENKPRTRSSYDTSQAKSVEVTDSIKLKDGNYIWAFSEQDDIPHNEIIKRFNLEKYLTIPPILKNLSWVKKHVEPAFMSTYPWISDEDRKKLKGRINKEKFDL